MKQPSNCEAQYLRRLRSCTRVALKVFANGKTTEKVSVSVSPTIKINETF